MRPRSMNNTKPSPCSTPRSSATTSPKPHVRRLHGGTRHILRNVEFGDKTHASEVAVVNTTSSELPAKHSKHGLVAIEKLL